MICGRNRKYNETRCSDHSSRSRIAPGLKQPTRGSSQRLLAKLLHRAGPALPSYLALLHAGFSVPRMLPPRRWALTPPFHPYQADGRLRRLVRFPFEPPQRRVSHRRFIFCGTFRSRALSSATPWRYQARCPNSRHCRKFALRRFRRRAFLSHSPFGGNLESGLSSRAALLRAQHRRSPDSPADSIIRGRLKRHNGTGLLRSDKLLELGFVEDWDFELAGFVVF
jgi:hypothetical protein